MSNDQYITIVGDDQRQSTLVMDGEGMRVMGVLPHGYTFKPLTYHDARKIETWAHNRALALATELLEPEEG